jgi:hypothetical protein
MKKQSDADVIELYVYLGFLALLVLYICITRQP